MSVIPALAYELYDTGHVTSLRLSVPAFEWKQYSCLAEILEAETTWKAPTQLFYNLVPLPSVDETKGHLPSCIP